MLVTLDAETSTVNSGRAKLVPVGAKHRIKNPNLDHLVVIEVHIGSHLGEDDIIRFDDKYSRS